MAKESMKKKKKQNWHSNFQHSPLQHLRTYSYVKHSSSFFVELSV